MTDYERFRKHSHYPGEGMDISWENCKHIWARHDFVPKFLPGDRVRIKNTGDIVKIRKLGSWYPYELEMLDGSAYGGAWGPDSLEGVPTEIDEDGNLY